ncbi:DUF3500 domain-containing protein [Elioraea sp.]|uniref:DUF3500 domain-containing protein n=1 Tax=Elioraea sp. TaxID=2185103 RepID=UPI003F6FC8C6
MTALPRRRLITLAALAASMPRAVRAASDAAAITDAASAYLREAADDPRARLAWDDPRRTDWHWFPSRFRPNREGVPIGEMSAPLRRAAHALLEASTTGPGAAKAHAIISLQHELRRGDPGAYFVSVYGTPGEGHWGWGIEGHHLSLNYAVHGDRIAAGPIFLGAHPTRVEAGERARLRAMAAEEDEARAALLALPAALRERAIVAEHTPRDTRTRNAVTVEPLPREGVAWSELPAESRERLTRAIHEYLGMMPPALAAAERTWLAAADPASLTFQWRGATVPDRFHYWAVQGHAFLIEHDNSRDGARHIHSVWRGFASDFGAAL